MAGRQWRCSICNRWFDYSQRNRAEHIADHDRVSEFFYYHPDILELDEYLNEYYLGI